MTPAAIREVYNEGPDAVIALVTGLFEVIAQLREQNALLTARVTALEEQLSKDSHNSSKPPSTDGFKKVPKSLRPRTGKPAGGQPGHPGSTLCLSETPDQILEHTPDACARCGRSLQDKSVDGVERRQVLDLPPLRLIVTEHRALIKRCSCDTLTTGPFPAEVSQPVQYGPGVRALGVYLQQVPLLPFERTQQIFRDLFQSAPSEGSLANFSALCHRRLAPVEAAIREALTQADVVHFDETGLRIDKKLHWLHVAGTQHLTLYQPHAKRGTAALWAMGILPVFHGTAVHDAWAPYFDYECRHQLCNAHLLRELVFVHEQLGQTWAKQAIALLQDMQTAVATARAAGASSLSASMRLRLTAQYEWILQQGWRVNAVPVPHTGVSTPHTGVPASDPKVRRGRPKRSPAVNLLERMQRRRGWVLAFLEDFAVPFDNNLAERDLRMIKVRQKVSGCFRAVEAAQQFCRIRGYISTMRKQGNDLLMALRSVFLGNPTMPALTA